MVINRGAVKKQAATVKFLIVYESCKTVTLSEFLIPQVIVYIDPMVKDISNKPEFEVLKLPGNVFPFESVAVEKLLLLLNITK